MNCAAAYLQPPGIEPRAGDLRFEDVPVHWLGGDPVVTRWFDALQISFPDGERFFIESVRNFADAVADPHLREDVRGFMRQEAQHGIAHSRFNDHMRGQGVDVDRILAFIQGELRTHQRVFPRKFQLAMTAALEHFTAMMGEGFMRPGVGLFERADPTMRALFLWHAVEEIEHKSVAYDVYQQAAGGGYFTRVGAMLLCTFMILTCTLVLQWHMMRVDGTTRRPGVLLRGFWRLFGWRGLMSSLLPRWLDWFRPGFHPWDSGMPLMARAWRAEWRRTGDIVAVEARLADQYPGVTGLPA